MWIFWLVLIIAVIWGAKVITSGGDNSSGKHQPARDILKERYARGEIDQQEFEQKLKDLTD